MVSYDDPMACTAVLSLTCACLTWSGRSSRPRKLIDDKMTHPPHAVPCAQQRSQSSVGLKGFSICSLPSTGETNTSSVPLATMSPSGRVDSLPSSSSVIASAHHIPRSLPRRSPLSISCTSSKTRFINWSYPFNVPTTMPIQSR